MPTSSSNAGYTLAMQSILEQKLNHKVTRNQHCCILQMTWKLKMLVIRVCNLGSRLWSATMFFIWRIPCVLRLRKVIIVGDSVRTHATLSGCASTIPKQKKHWDRFPPDDFELWLTAANKTQHGVEMHLTCRAHCSQHDMLGLKHLYPQGFYWLSFMVCSVELPINAV